MYLITSANYIDSELQSEFGAIPPCFLPVGNKRLFYHQLKTIPSDQTVVMMLPQGFTPECYDLQFLQKNQIILLYLPTHLNLGESIAYTLNSLKLDHDEPLYILHGDTLIDDMASTPNTLGVSKVAENYNWSEYQIETGLLLRCDPNDHNRSDLIANGFFSFAAPNILIKHISLAKWDFIEGVNGYQQEVGMQAVLSQRWLDFGHIQTYYASKSAITTQRAFNEMKINQRVVCKTSSKANKLAAEANWYRNIPGPLKIYTPQLLGWQHHANSFEYSIEYLHLTALNELYVFSKLPAFAWRKIINACCQFITDAQQFAAPANAIQANIERLFTYKTQQRLADYALTNRVDLDQSLTINGRQHLSLTQLSVASQKLLPTDNKLNNVIHGDLCFSNILYDSRTASIKVIDPRGIDEHDKPTIYGNSWYDIAKLAHSIIGLYDLIIAGYFTANRAGNKLSFDLAITERHEQISAIFIELIAKEFELSANQLYAMQIQLFLSMLPLHDDRPDRQLGFICNAYRLYDKITN
ncbi:MAG: capsular biosynthesis protein [Gammaproteobacteria bacterium]|nr:capsular biosynthesis protein [Gammaproteobacteria bacterium]